MDHFGLCDPSLLDLTSEVSFTDRLPPHVPVLLNSPDHAIPLSKTADEMAYCKIRKSLLASQYLFWHGFLQHDDKTSLIKNVGPAQVLKEKNRRIFVLIGMSNIFPTFKQ